MRFLKSAIEGSVEPISKALDLLRVFGARYDTLEKSLKQEYLAKVYVTPEKVQIQARLTSIGQDSSTVQREAYEVFYRLIKAPRDFL